MQGSYGASLVVRAIGTWATYNGLAIIIGGTLRWGNSAYDVVNLMPGSPYTWGIILVICGGLVMYGSLTSRFLPLKNLHYSRPALNYHAKGIKEVIGTKDVTIDWSSVQFRNAGFKIMAAWLMLFGIAFFITIFTLPDISFGFGSRDFLIAVICVIMTNVREPQHVTSR